MSSPELASPAVLHRAGSPRGLAAPSRIGPSGSPGQSPGRNVRSSAGQSVTALSREGRSAEAVWDALPPLVGLNVTRPKPGATVLLEHPTLKVDGKPAPLLALWDFGRGLPATPVELPPPLSRPVEQPSPGPEGRVPADWKHLLHRL